MPALNPVVAEVTARIVERSRQTRADYLRRMDAARDSGAGRAKLSCANWAHAFAGQTIADKLTAMGGKQPEHLAPGRGETDPPLVAETFRSL